MQTEELKEQLKRLEDRICTLRRKNASLENKVEKMKCCGNCSHNPRLSTNDDTEYCWNCDRSCSKFGKQIIEDEWELAD